MEKRKKSEVTGLCLPRKKKRIPVEKGQWGHRKTPDVPKGTNPLHKEGELAAGGNRTR